MSLKKWLGEGKLQRHQTSPEEIKGLLSLAERDIQNAGIKELDADWRFAIAYNAILQLATIPLYLAGYKTDPKRGGHHWVTITTLVDTMGTSQKARMRYFNNCRSQRNATTYESASLINEAEANEIVQEAMAFRADLVAWLKEQHPEFVI